MDMRDLLTVGSFITTIIIFAVGILVNYLAVIMPMKTDIAIIKTQVEPIWRYVLDSVAKQLHSPHTPELDHYLDMMTQGKLNRKDDLLSLKYLIEGMAITETDKSRSIALSFLYDFVNAQLNVLAIRAKAYTNNQRERRSSPCMKS